MTLEKSIDARYNIVATAISKAGGSPIPTSDTLLKLLTYFIMEDELDFVAVFNDQKSQTMEQLKQRTGLTEEEILEKTKALAARGVIFNQPNSAGVMVYRLLPLLNVGMFEYTFMGKLEDNARNREISELFRQLFEGLSELVQQNYDQIMPLLMKAPPVDRTVPFAENKATGNRIKIVVNASFEAPLERILPAQEVETIIDKFDEIALGYCFCRHHKDLLGRPCKQTDEREACFTFGKSARYTSEQGFARMITKAEAIDVLRRSEAAGLVHKAYHPNFDTGREETSICNCCRCCCGNSVDNSISAVRNVTQYLAVIDTELCTGCGTCVENCHTGAAYLGEDGKARRTEDHCIGCGVCAAFCPENAISLLEGERIVTIPARRKT